MFALTLIFFTSARHLVDQIICKFSCPKFLKNSSQNITSPDWCINVAYISKSVVGAMFCPNLICWKTSNSYWDWKRRLLWSKNHHSSLLFQSQYELLVFHTRWNTRSEERRVFQRVAITVFIFCAIVKTGPLSFGVGSFSESNTCAPALLLASD